MIGAPTIILCYHRVAEGVADPFHLCVSPANFAAQLRALASRGDFATLDEVASPARRARFVVTFDDGYADNLIHALPLAEELGVPMTVYVTSAMIGRREGFWWDRLARLLAGGREAAVTVELPVRSPAGLMPWRLVLGAGRGGRGELETLHAALRSRPVAEIESALAALGGRLGVEPVAPEDARPLEAGELAKLAVSRCATIGAHTVDHVLLKEQPVPAQREAVQRSRGALEQSLHLPVRHFAYPFGGRDSFDARTVDVVRAAGFTTAVSTIPGSVRPSSPQLELPRRLVMNWATTRFRAQVARWGVLR